MATRVQCASICWATSCLHAREQDMKRRQFLAALATWPFAANAQPPRLIIGFLHQGALPPQSARDAFRKGLVEAGISDGLSIAIEDRWADGQYDRLPALAADLISHHVAVIAADFLPAAQAAKAATQTIPIVFLSGSDPIGAGLVSSINRPTGNVTGIAPMFTLLGTKNLELVHELVPKVTVIGALVNLTNPNAEHQVKDLQSAAGVLGQEIVILPGSNDRQIDDSFAAMAQRRIGALVVTADGFLISRQERIVTLAARHT